MVRIKRTVACSNSSFPLLAQAAQTPATMTRSQSAKAIEMEKASGGAALDANAVSQHRHRVFSLGVVISRCTTMVAQDEIAEASMFEVDSPTAAR
jgi:hypothetical protein